MKDWESKLDDFLRFNDREVLPNAGTVTKQLADKHAASEYGEYSSELRAKREIAGEKDYINQLEAAAKILPGRKNPSQDN